MKVLNAVICFLWAICMSLAVKILSFPWFFLRPFLYFYFIWFAMKIAGLFII
jgi:hypothetical protein